MSSTAKHWRDLPVKDRLSYVSALVGLFVGFGLTIAGFVVAPTGEVHDSILWVLGQALAFAAAIFGFALYAKKEVAVQLAQARAEEAEAVINTQKQD